MDEGAEIHALPCGTGGGYGAWLKCRMKDVRQISMNTSKCHAGAGVAILVPGTRRFGGSGRAGSWVR